MKQLSRVINILVFIFTTLAVAGVLYEGLTLKWYPIVGILIMTMDYSFLASTVINIFVERKSKWFKVNIFSLVLLVVAIGMKIANIDYSPVALVFWYLYIWTLYGVKTFPVLTHHINH